MAPGTTTNPLARTLGVLAWLCLGLGLGASVAAAQDYGVDWVTIGDPGNAPYPGDDHGNMAGRGGVGYEYRIGRDEVTTGQWLEFVNTFSTQSDDFTYFARPDFWGATIDFSYQGPGRRYILRDDVERPEMLPVGGISWRDAAMFCNWLDNNKSSDLSAIENGAYDTSTFTTNSDGTFNDQLTHNPDAKYWIPTLDEWLKAAHYDPDKNGRGQAGWWEYPISSDEPPIYGVPGEGQANAGFELPDYAEWDIPLGSYPDVRSPWGLLDAAGGSAEWAEDWWPPDNPRYRLGEGSYAGLYLPDAELADHISRFGLNDRPDTSPWGAGLRVAAAIPAPGLSVYCGIVAVFCGSRCRRRGSQP